MGYDRFVAESGRVNDVLNAVNLLTWDARTQMPAGGTASRGQQIATLTSLARGIVTGPAMRDALAAAWDEVAAEPEDSRRRRAVAAMQEGLAALDRIPEPLLHEAALLKTEAQAAWVAARARSDFPAFRPYLERSFALQRRVADALGWAEHPYDALVAQYEPGMTLGRLRPLFAALRSRLVPLIARAQARPAPRRDFLERDYPVDRQKAFARTLTELVGFDYGRGRLDEAVHPFEISFTRGDVRITSRYRPNFLPAGLFAALHEAGHGLYEQGIDPELGRSVLATDIVNLYAVGGASFGLHESQSRLLENRVGRSRRFWDLHFPLLRDAFPQQLADVSAEEFWRAVNLVRPGLIRVEADELTYDLHIMLRVELEAAVIAGDLTVADLPAAWAGRMRDDLGLEVPDDARGVLQDIHWSTGYVGSFPTYTLGNVMASQLFAVAERDPAVAGGLEAGDYTPLRLWLNQAVHRHGRSRLPEEILRAATGGGLDPAPYLAYLEAKHGS
ncbi:MULTISPECIES: carboxypeptidase M32 [unclassified Inquilinus]|uniref:carboxypeptidase M32 n=1 Tax=unclassified Inquilinus TaxID=2645927 RepID=UPI003F906E8E